MFDGTALRLWMFDATALRLWMFGATVKAMDVWCYC